MAITGRLVPTKTPVRPVMKKKADTAASPSAARVGDDDAALIGAQACAPRRRDSRDSGVVFAQLFRVAQSRDCRHEIRGDTLARPMAASPPYCQRASLLRAGA
jgi:hypothetical protein